MIDVPGAEAGAEAATSELIPTADETEAERDEGDLAEDETDLAEDETDLAEDER